jgi:tripartite-type tricarboxylate transporter receptor subunit TctC
MKRSARIGLRVAAALAGLAPALVHADSVADFYRDKTLNLVVAHEAGTGFDVYSRVLQRFYGRHIPGNPNVVVQNMPGASGITSTNWLYNIAPKDGTVLGTASNNVPLEPLFGNTAARFDPGKMNWIGNMEESSPVCGVASASGIKTFEDLRTRETVFGATGGTGPLVVSSLAIKALLGAKLKIISGYKGSASVKLAIMTGEVAGICGLPMSTIKSFWRDEYESGTFKPVIQLSGPRSLELAGIAHADDFIKTEEDRQVFGLIFGSQALGRTYSAPPDVPADRIAALRKAFMDTMADKEFLADAAKTQIAIVPMEGAKVAAQWASYAASPKPIVDRVFAIMTGK